MSNNKKRFGDRKDATLIRDIDALHIAMLNCYGKRTENEAYISEQIDLEPIKKWIAKHPDEEFKYTFFHLIVAAIIKLLVIRPKLNRFILNKRLYQKDERSASFVVKRQFNDEAKEGMAILSGDENSDVFKIHELIKKQVLPCKQGKNNETEDSMEVFTKIPYCITKLIFKFVLALSEKGKLPKSLTSGDSNHSSVFITNLGSIGLKCGYHHLSNYGTSSIFVVIGEKKLTPFYDLEGNVTVKETLDVGFTIDERIADGYYYAKSMKIFRKILENPELLEKPFDTEVEL